MKSNQHLILVIALLLFACQERNNANRRLKNHDLKTQSSKKGALNNPILSTKKYNSDTKPVFIAPEIPDPIPPYDPYDPYDPVPYPIDPPGYIPEPEPIGLPSTPKTIRDSLVLFPVVVASFDTNTAAIYKYFDNKIAGTMEWKYLQEIGTEGRIFLRLLIDTKGKVRDVSFLRFDATELEILKPKLTKAALQMPLWIPAKNEQGEPVVSEVVFTLRIGIR
jgi:hypothetical protein